MKYQWICNMLPYTPWKCTLQKTQTKKTNKINVKCVWINKILLACYGHYFIHFNNVVRSKSICIYWVSTAPHQFLSATLKKLNNYISNCTKHWLYSDIFRTKTMMGIMNEKLIIKNFLRILRKNHSCVRKTQWLQMTYDKLMTHEYMTMNTLYS